MTIAKQYYLSCNKCHKIYASKADDPQGLEVEALDDGWTILIDEGTDYQGDILSTHACDSCSKSS